MIVLNTKNYTLLLLILLINTVCFGQRFPVQYPKADYLQPEKFIFDEHIDSSKVKSLIKLTAKYRTPKVLDTFYIEYFNPKKLQIVHVRVYHMKEVSFHETLEPR